MPAQIFIPFQFKPMFMNIAGCSIFGRDFGGCNRFRVLSSCTPDFRGAKLFEGFLMVTVQSLSLSRNLLLVHLGSVVTEKQSWMDRLD